MKKLLIPLALLAIGMGFYLTFLQTLPPEPLLDDRLQVLAENEREGWCAGFTLVDSGGPNSKAATRCRSDNPEKGNIRDLQIVMPSFCDGAIDAGWGGTFYECTVQLDEMRYWPTLVGGLTNDWSTQHPYPLDKFGTSQGTREQDSRTGDRLSNER